MHPYHNNIGHLFDAENVAYQGAGLSAGAATAGTGVSLGTARSFVLSATFAGTTGSPTTSTVTFALESSADNSTWHTANDRDGNAVTLAVTAANKTGSVNVDTQYFTKGDLYVRVTPTVAFTGGTSPTAYFSANFILGGLETLPA
jgi:hypothetical protein